MMLFKKNFQKIHVSLGILDKDSAFASNVFLDPSSVKCSAFTKIVQENHFWSFSNKCSWKSLQNVSKKRRKMKISFSKDF